MDNSIYGKITSNIEKHLTLFSYVLDKYTYT